MISKSGEKLKGIIIESKVIPIKIVKDDPYSVILARALLLFLLTFNVFLNAYVMMSLDRSDLLIGLLTIVIGVLGQFAAITGQFGWKIGNLLLNTFVISDLLLIIISLLAEQNGRNFMTKLSFCFTMISLFVGLFIVMKKFRSK